MYDFSSPFHTLQHPLVYLTRVPPLDWQVMNELALHRGASPHLNTIDVFVDGQHLTEAVVCSDCCASIADC